MFSDHDNLSNAAAAAPASEAEPAPNSAQTETNNTVESATEPTAPPATEQAEAVNPGQGAHVAPPSEQAEPASTPTAV